MGETLPLFYKFHFYLFGLFALGAATVFVTRKSPIAAAMWLVVTMFSLAAMYVMLDAHFIGAIQVIVYAGAIMVVFLFVIMLLNLGDAATLTDARNHWWKIGAGALGLGLLAYLMVVARFEAPAALQLPVAQSMARQVAAQGAIAPVAGPLFTRYLLAFEVTSVLLLAAVVGAVVLGKQRRADDAR
jgi:NADH-quinone oxidoreductase subunit J